MRKTAAQVMSCQLEPPARQVTYRWLANQPGETIGERRARKGDRRGGRDGEQAAWPRRRDLRRHSACDRTFGGIYYLNCGDWVENCTAIVETMDGDLQLVHWPNCPPTRIVEGERGLAPA